MTSALATARQEADQRGALPHAADDYAYLLTDIPDHLRQLVTPVGAPPRSPIYDHGMYPKVLRLLFLSHAYRHVPYLLRVAEGFESDTVIDREGGVHQVPVKHQVRVATIMAMAKLGFQGVKMELEASKPARSGGLRLPPLQQPEG